MQSKDRFRYWSKGIVEMFFIRRSGLGMGKWMDTGQPMTDLQILRFSIDASSQDQGPNCQNVHSSASSCFHISLKLTDQPSSPVLVWGRSRWGGDHSRWRWRWFTWQRVGLLDLEATTGYWRPPPQPPPHIRQSPPTLSLSNDQKLIQDGPQ